MARRIGAQGGLAGVGDASSSRFRPAARSTSRRASTRLHASSAPDTPDPVAFLASAGAALAALRKIKSEAKVSQRTEIASVELLVPESQLGGDSGRPHGPVLGWPGAVADRGARA